MAKKKVSNKGVNKNLVIGIVVVLLLIGVFWYFNNQKEVGLMPPMPPMGGAGDGDGVMPEGEMPPGDIPKGCPIDFRTCLSNSGPSWCCANTERCGESKYKNSCVPICDVSIESVCFKDGTEIKSGNAWCCPIGLCPENPKGPICDDFCLDEGKFMCGTHEGYKCCPVGETCVDSSVNPSGCQKIDPDLECMAGEQSCGLKKGQCCPEGEFCAIPGNSKQNPLCCRYGTYYDDRFKGCISNDIVWCDDNEQTPENACPKDHTCCGEVCCLSSYECKEINGKKECVPPEIN